MKFRASRWLRYWKLHLVGGLALSCMASTPIFAQENGAKELPAFVQTHEARPISLPEAVEIALRNQPAIDAYRASVAAAETNRRGLKKLPIPALIARELPIRRNQSILGVTIASANLAQAEDETIYAVTRLYHSVVFARQQKKVADSVVNNLKATLDTAKRLVDAGSREVTTSSVEKINIYLRLAETKQAEAERGLERATAALREAIGLGCENIAVVDDTLPEHNTVVDRCAIVNLALAQRHEIVQALGASELTALEVQAQGTSCRLEHHTFAYGGDIHAKQVPQGYANGEYRPGAVGIEMPVALVGCRKYRVERAKDFQARAAAVVDKTRNLVALDAEDAFFKWEEASKKVPQTREAAEKATKLADDTRNDFGGGQKVKVDEVLTNEILAAQARAQYNEARYNLVLSLAGLERATAGGFQAGLAPRTSCKP